MASKYKHTGTITSLARMRDFKRWVIAFDDGEEETLSRKKYAKMAFKSLSAQGRRARVFEETVMRTVTDENVRNDSFRIDITERIKLEILAESF